jgi:2-methylcitrate dehydratase PrpD
MTVAATLAMRLARLSRDAANGADGAHADDLRAHLLDTLGLVAAAEGHESLRLTRAFLLEGQAASAVMDAEAATFLWAAAADALALDDFDEATRLHPGAAVVPAALAALPAQAPFCALEAAVAGGYDMLLRLGDAAGSGRLHARGQHPSSVFGTLGAAAAAGLAMGLDDAQLTAAIAIASSLAAGHFELDGANRMRGVQMGQAAANGLRACRLARAGFRPNPLALDGAHGFLALFAGNATLAVPLDETPGLHRIAEVSFKPYAHFTDLNPMTAALLEAAADRIGGVGTLPERIEIALTPKLAGKLTPAWPPRDAKAAQRSPHWVAACILAAPGLPGPQDPLVEVLRFDAQRVAGLDHLAARISWHAADMPDGVASLVSLTEADGSLHQAAAAGYPGDGRDRRQRWTSAAIGRRLNAIGKGSRSVAELWFQPPGLRPGAGALRDLLPRLR